jgi:cysteine desulfurase / selenocysteine lyase
VVRRRNATTQKYEDARETTRRFLNARHAEEIIFTKNATEAVNLVAQSWGMGSTNGKPNVIEGDEIVLSILEHHSNIVPWNFLRERKGAVIKWAPISDTGEFLMDAFEKLLTPRTKMIALTHMSNVTGTLVPVKEPRSVASRCSWMAAKVLCT